MMREWEWRVLIQSGGHGRGSEEWTSELRCTGGRVLLRLGCISVPGRRLSTHKSYEPENWRN